MTQQTIVRVPPEHMESLLLTIEQFLTQTQVLARIFLSLLGKRLSCSRQTSFTTATDVPVVGLESSYSTPGSSSSDHQYDPISFEMVDGQLAQGTFIHPPDPYAYLFTDASHYGWSSS